MLDTCLGFIGEIALLGAEASDDRGHALCRHEQRRVFPFRGYKGPRWQGVLVYRQQSTVRYLHVCC